MATHVLLTALLTVLSVPFLLASRLMTRLNLYGLSEDLEHCLDAVDRAPCIPVRFVVTLIAAEDHRSPIHPGVDPISMLRALLVWIRAGKLQGASTIEQQLVRVIVGRYEWTAQRKIKEQMLAIALSRKRTKARIAEAYLSVAFYGSGQYGIRAIRGVCGPDLDSSCQDSISHIVARLKYPKPLNPSVEWQLKASRRVEYIASRLQGAPRNALQPTRNQEHSYSRANNRLEPTVVSLFAPTVATQD